MQRLRCTFKRSRTPTGAEMKSQSSLEVPKQVRSASFDEIQLEACHHQQQCEPSSSGTRQQAEMELRSIAGMAMATSNTPPSPRPASGGALPRKLSTLRIPQQLAGTQRSKSLDASGSLLERSAATSRWKSSDGQPSSAHLLQAQAQAQPQQQQSQQQTIQQQQQTTQQQQQQLLQQQLSQPYTCWHCACVEEWRASQAGASLSGDSWDDEELRGEDAEDADEEECCDSSNEIEPDAVIKAGAPTPQLERDEHDNLYYFVVLQRASEDADDDASDCSRREGSPEIRITLSQQPKIVTSDEVDSASSEADQQVGATPSAPITLPPGFTSERRRSLSRQEALPELPAILGISVTASDDDEDEEIAAAQDDVSTEETIVRIEEEEEEREPEQASAGELVVRDIFLTVPDLKRDRAASVDSCFKNGKSDACYSLQVPQQSTRSKSVDIVLPTDVQTRYTALLPEATAFAGDKDDGGTNLSQREPRSTPDWSDAAVNGEHLWVPTAASGEFCYVNDCSKHGPRLKCSACRVVAHTACTTSLNFACKPSYRDVGVRQYREQKVTNHHWVHRRSQKGKCANCSKSFQSKLSFSSKEIVAVSCSWCKSAYHNRESCFNAQKIGEQCELGLHSSIMVPPSWIVKVPKRGNFKSSLRKSPKKKRSQGGGSKKPNKGEDDKEASDPLKLWAIKPIPNSNVSPVLVFINPRSGGNQGAKLLQKFQWLLNPRQVFDLTQGGPNMGLELFKKVPNLRILACGGDGTVGWVLSVLDKIGADPPPAVGTLPLGTGNDLARALGWGGGYTDEPIGKILVSTAESEITILDRWKLDVERNPDAQGNDEDASKGKENLPLNVVNNYFSLGVDAHIALEFHEAREAHPERFNSRLRNKMFYGQMGGKDLVVRRWKDLSEFVTLECDGQDVTSKLKEHRVHAILFLNIASYGGGTHPWGGGIGREPTTEDGLIEVVGLTTYQLPLLQAGGHGTSIAQCSTAKLVTTRTIPMQVDGEACRLLPSIINLSLLNKATMLSKRRGGGGGRHRQKASEVEKLKVPLMRILMADYENWHSDRERLAKTATQWRSELLELDAAMDLDSLRKMLAKDYPMDSCCFLDSCTAERFFRIDRAQEQLHYVADVVSEAIYILHEGSSGSQSQYIDNQSSSRDDRRKTSAEKKARTESNQASRDSRFNSRDDHNQQQQQQQSQSRNRSRNQSHASRASGYSNNPQMDNNYPEESTNRSYSKHQRGSKSMGSGASNTGVASMQHKPPTFISPRDRLFGLSPDVHTFSAEMLERTSDGILRAAKVGDLGTLRHLHSRGYSLLSIDANGQTALHLASHMGFRDVVRYLIACAPATILNMVDNDKGQTALHKAAQQKRRSICCMLVAGGAKLTVRDRSGNTPRELALIAEDRELAAYLQSQEQFQLVTEDMDNIS